MMTHNFAVVLVVITVIVICIKGGGLPLHLRQNRDQDWM